MKSANVLLIIPKYNLTQEADYTYAFPTGLGYISSVLKNAKYNVTCLNLNHFKGTIQGLVTNALNKNKYEIICTGGNCLHYTPIKAILDAAKKHSSCPITIIGGAMITSEPELFFEALKPDYAVIGEGEKTILSLLNNLENPKKLEKIKGLMYFNQGKIVFTGISDCIEDINSLPYPDFEGFGFEEQLKHMHSNDYYYNSVLDYPRTYPLLGSRGCPFSCTFCYHYGKYRARTIKSIIKEISTMMERYNINNLIVYDEILSTNPKRIYDFCKNINILKKKFQRNLKWSCQMRVDNVSEDILKVMKEAGCESISYGFESFSPIVLESMGKHITPEQIENAFYGTLANKIGIQANFIFGDIAETKKTSKETLEWWKKNCKGQIGIGLIQPYPGSVLYNYCLKKGIIKNRMDYIENKMGPYAVINMTEKINDEDFKKLYEEILDSFSRYARFVRPISVKKQKKQIYSFRVRCPYCKKLMLYQNCYIKNRFAYGFYMHCRNCNMRFFIVSFIQRIAYKYYSKTRFLRDYIKRIIGHIKKKKL